MNKSDIDAAIAEKHGLSTKQVDAITDDFLKGIMGAVKTDGEADLHRFGTFELRQLKARKGRNPKTGEAVDIAATKTAAFRPWKAFKDFLNEA